MIVTKKQFEDLLPCPFCGGEAEIITRDVEPQGDSWYGRKDETFPACTVCGGVLFDEYWHEGFWEEDDKPNARAIKSWNTRAPQAQGVDEWKEVHKTSKNSGIPYPRPTTDTPNTSEALEYFNKMCKVMALENTSSFPEVQTILAALVERCERIEGELTAAYMAGVESMRDKL